MCKIVGFLSENATKTSEQKEGCISVLSTALVNQSASHNSGGEVYSAACLQPVPHQNTAGKNSVEYHEQEHE
jgi:hypothetical protein